jgi:hypothetical protein
MILRIIIALFVSSSILHAQDSLVSKKFSFGGYGKEFGIGGAQINKDRAMLFNITSNCVTGNCQHGLGMALVSDNGQLIKSAAFGNAVNDFDVVEAYGSKDGTCMMLGQTIGTSLIFQKLDTNLNILWNKNIPLDAAISQSGLYLYAAKEIDNKHEVLVANQWCTFDNLGNLIRSRKYLNGFNATNKFDLSAITKLAANSFVVGGHICDVAGFDSDPFLMLTDSLGNKLKSKKYQISASPFTDQITAVLNNGANEILAFGHKFNDFFMMSLDSNLAINWAKSYTAPNLNAYTHQITKVNANCYVAVGSGVSFAFDASGGILWSKSIDFGSQPKVFATDTCHFAIYSTKSINNWGSGYYNKMDAQSNAAIQNFVNIPLLAINMPVVAYTPNIIFGGSTSAALGSINFTIVPSIKAVDSASVMIKSNANCDIEIPNNTNNIIKERTLEIYPNPSNGIFNIKNKSVNFVRVYNTMGLNIYSSRLVSNQINLTTLPKGNYYLQLFSNEDVVIKKVKLG